MGALRFPEWQKLCESVRLGPDAKSFFQQVMGD
jgi:hypothetical protein